MNLEALHRIPNFAELQSDPRFVGLVMHLASKRPKAASHEAHGMIQDSGKLEAFLQFHEDIKAAFVAPPKKKEEKPRVSPFPSQSYTDGQIPVSPENK